MYKYALSNSHCGNLIRLSNLSVIFSFSAAHFGDVKFSIFQAFRATPSIPSPPKHNAIAMLHGLIGDYEH